jgi:membrane associated rhomboid family serine protease
MITLIVFFVLQSALSMLIALPLDVMLGLSAKHFLSGYFFQLLTYPLVGRGLIEVIFNGLMFWFIGCELEERWGRVRYISFLVASAIGGGLFYIIITGFIFQSDMLFSLPLTGLSGVVGSLLLAYAIIYPDKIFTFMLIIPMKAKYFCMLLIGILLYMGIFSPSGVQSWGHLGAMLSGFFYLVWITRSQAMTLKKLNTKRKSGHLRIIENEDKTNPPKYWH